MPVAVTSFGAASDGQYIYALGGYHGEPHHYTQAGQSRELWRLALDGSTGWEQLSEIETGGLHGLALVYHDNAVCRFGGNRVLEATDGSSSMESINEAACFELDTQRWRSLPALPEGRSSHAAGVVDDTVYVVGGWQISNEPSQQIAEDRLHSEMLTLDLNSPEPSWQTVPVPQPRRALGVASADGKLVMIGGMDEDREITHQVDLFDPISKRWTRGPDFPTDTFGIAAVGFGDIVYASARDGVIWTWQVGSEDWKPLSSLAFSRFFHQLVMTPVGELIAVGGISGMHTLGRTRHVEKISINSEGPTFGYFEIPYPGQAKNRQGTFLNDDLLYLFGGNVTLERHAFEPENFVAEGWRFHLPSMSWQRVADYPHHRQTLHTLTLDQHGISLGGFGYEDGAATTQSDVYTFDFDQENWTRQKSLLEGRTQFGLAYDHEQLWIFGGLNYDPQSNQTNPFNHVTTTLMATLTATSKAASEDSIRFEPSDNDLPASRRAFAGTVLDGHYYLVGGMRENFDLVEDCLAYDLAANSFSSIACPRRPRIGAHLLAFDQKLFLIGGSSQGDNGTEPDWSVEVYDPLTNSWEVLIEEIPFDPKFAHAFVYDQRLLLASTHQSESHIRFLLIDP